VLVYKRSSFSTTTQKRSSLDKSDNCRAKTTVEHSPIQIMTP